MRNFVFITDSHFRLKSNTRTGDYLEDLVRKLDWTVDYCNQNKAALLHGGDWFDTPSVPDLVKARVIRSLSRCRYGVYGIPGNHDTLYNNPELQEKTSFNILVEAGLVADLGGGDIEFDDCVLTGTLPVRACDRPVIALYHGFLNREDGRSTFTFTDIAPHANDLLVLLGHDHLRYEDLRYGDNCTIIRPGSFARDERTKEHMRTPQLVHIVVDNGYLSYKYVDIASARSCEDIFKAKEASVSGAYKEATYSEVIAQLASAQKNRLSFEEALSKVSEPDVYAYCVKLLEDSRRADDFKNQNL